MKQAAPIIIALLIIISAGFYLWQQKETVQAPAETTEETVQKPAAEQPDEQVGLANPASVNCEEKGGTLEIEKDNEGNEVGMCKLEDDYRCEEWAFFRGECAYDADAALIRQALIDKGLDLSMMKVVIMNHTGKYIEGGVVPGEGVMGGGGYVYAYKDGGEVTIIADGNGVIFCEKLEDYADLPTFMIPECYSEATGTSIVR